MAEVFDFLRDPAQWDSLLRSYPDGADNHIYVFRMVDNVVLHLDRQLRAAESPTRIALDRPRRPKAEATGLVIFDGHNTYIHPLKLHNCSITIGGQRIFLAHAGAVLALLNALIDEIALTTSRRDAA